MPSTPATSSPLWIPTRTVQADASPRVAATMSKPALTHCRSGFVTGVRRPAAAINGITDRLELLEIVTFRDLLELLRDLGEGIEHILGVVGVAILSESDDVSACRRTSIADASSSQWQLRSSPPVAPPVLVSRNSSPPFTSAPETSSTWTCFWEPGYGSESPSTEPSFESLGYCLESPGQVPLRVRTNRFLGSERRQSKQVTAVA